MVLIKRVRGWLLITLFGGVIVNVFVRVHLANSGAYKAARQYLTSDLTVIQKLGDVKSASRAFFDLFNVEFGFGDNSAEMSVKLEGSRSSGKAHVTLKQNGENWEITGAELKLSDETQIHLMQ